MIQLNKYSAHPSLRETKLYCPDGSQERVEAYLSKVKAHIEAVQVAGSHFPGVFFHLEYSYGIFQENLKEHDLSKFSPTEVFGYANYNFGQENTEEQEKDFKLAWFHHKRENPHHPEYWMDIDSQGNVTPLPMPNIYIMELLADWCGASKIYGTKMEDWTKKNLPKILFHPETREKVESCLPRLLKYAASQGY